MIGDKVSIIIPAYNEEKHIMATIESVKAQDYRPMELIVVVNGSKDRTFEIAKRYADKTLNFPGAIGVSAARNEGAKVAKGDILLFLDADTHFSKDTIKKMAESVTSNTLGTCLGKAEGGSLKGKLFFLFKNYTHRLRIYKGVIDGVLICHRNVFFKVNGFDKTRRIAEFQDFIKRALNAGAKYKLFTNCHVVVSLRRFEKKGYFKILLFWVKWKIVSFVKKGNKISKQYFEIKK